MISMNNDMFKTIKDDSDLSEISFNFDKFQIFTTESSSIVNMMKDDFRKLIQNGILSEMMTVKDEESKVSFLVDKASKTKENVSVFFMIVEEEDPTVPKLQKVIKLAKYVPYEKQLNSSREALWRNLKRHFCSAIVAQGQALQEWIYACEQ